MEDCISLTLNNFTAVNAVRGRKNKVVVKRASFKYCSSNIDVFTNESRSNNLRFVSKALRKQFSKNIYSFRIINKIQCVGWPATYRSTRANQMISSFHLFHTASNDYIILSLWICCKRTLLSWHCCHEDSRSHRRPCTCVCCLFYTEYSRFYKYLLYFLEFLEWYEAKQGTYKPNIAFTTLCLPMDLQLLPAPFTTCRGLQKRRFLYGSVHLPQNLIVALVPYL